MDKLEQTLGTFLADKVTVVGFGACAAFDKLGDFGKDLASRRPWLAMVATVKRSWVRAREAARRDPEWTPLDFD